jgi:hypothetical protein
MSSKAKILTFALALTLTVIVGRSLSTTTFRNAVGVMASAVWGS